MAACASITQIFIWGRVYVSLLSTLSGKCDLSGSFRSTHCPARDCLRPVRGVQALTPGAPSRHLPARARSVAASGDLSGRYLGARTAARYRNHSYTNTRIVQSTR